MKKSHRQLAHPPAFPILPSSHLTKAKNPTNKLIFSVPQHIGLTYSSPSQQLKLNPCERLGLDIGKLQDEELLKFDSYRRLYTIVVNEKMGKNEIVRCNLIK
jgi:hypothetical protein